jgi:hypothetical protein
VFKRAVELQAAVTAYANFYIERVKNEDAFAWSSNNQLPNAQPWMRLDSLGAVNCQVVTEYMDVLKPLNGLDRTPRIDRIEQRQCSSTVGSLPKLTEASRTQKASKVK